MDDLNLVPSTVEHSINAQLLRPAQKPLLNNEITGDTTVQGVVILVKTHLQ